MTGKVFAESANLYQDEAKVIFDYYKAAAEKIVAEEKDLEAKIAQAEKDVALAKKNKTTATVFTVIFGVLAAAGIIISLTSQKTFFMVLGIALLIPTLVSLVKIFKAKKAIALGETQKKGFGEAHDAVRRDYKVTKLGVAYVPVATRVPFEGKTFVVDHTGGMSNTEFALSVLHQPQEFQQSLSDLENGIASVPVVENNENAEQVDTSDYSLSMQNVTMHDYMGNIDRQVRNISYLLGDNDSVSVALPVIPPESAEDHFIDEYATTDTNEKPVVKVFNVDGYSDKLAAFSKLNDMKKELEKRGNEDNIEYFKKLMKKLGESVQIISKVKTNSTTKLLDYSNMILSAVLKAGYNQYSPTLEAEEIGRIREASFNFEDSVNDYHPFNLKASSRVKYDLFGGAWVAEDNTRTNMPFGMNQIQEEVLMPVINNLMNETRIERLKIYNGIKDQKMHYLNEWNKDVEDAFRDNRKSGNDLITQITNAYAEYNTAYQTYTSYKATQDSLKKSGNLADSEVQEKDNAAEQIAGFEAQAQQCNKTSEEFQQYMERLQDDITAKAEQFGHIEYYEASLRDSESRDFARSQDPDNLQSLDDRRKRLIPVNSYYATYAKIPPAPSVEPKLMEDFTLNLEQTAVADLNSIAQQEVAAQAEAEAAKLAAAQAEAEAKAAAEKAEAEKIAAEKAEAEAKVVAEKAAAEKAAAEAKATEESEDGSDDEDESDDDSEEDDDSDGEDKPSDGE